MSCQFIYTSPALKKKQGGPPSPPKKKQQQPNTLHYFAQRRTGCDQIRVEHILCIYKSTSQEAHAFCSSKRLAVIVWRCEGPIRKNSIRNQAKRREWLQSRTRVSSCSVLSTSRVLPRPVRIYYTYRQNWLRQVRADIYYVYIQYRHSHLTTKYFWNQAQNKCLYTIFFIMFGVMF